MKSIKENIWYIVAGVLVALGMAAAIIASARSDARDKTAELLERIESALGEDWKKQTVTRVFDWVYSDGEGNTIIYYLCVTEYYEADATGQTGLNTEAICAVISADEAESSRECDINGLPGAIFQKGGRAYLCWTILPELSCVIEYDPACESEEDMLRMAQSVPTFQNPAPKG